MTYSWTIISFETRDVVNDAAASLADAVVSVKWKRDGVDSGGATGSVLGYTVLAAESTAEGDFVAFSSLTESQVVNWIESAIGSDKLAEYNTAIQAKINKQGGKKKSPPWA